MLYIFFADGFEEVEAIATMDVLRRAGIETVSVGIGSKTITGAHNIPVICDTTADKIEFNNSVDGIILPGGMPGTTNLMNSFIVNDFIDLCYKNGKIICAICAAPMILGRKGLLNNREAVCFPGFEDELKGAVLSEKFVCNSNGIITAKGMGSAVNFGLEIISEIKGKEISEKIKSTLQCS
ncbi:MAG: DJ-1/PfpI family protein [Clostridia bacterium]|nr:DJ-1/PfpI family protein [Clostridia bacterium]